MSHQNHRGHQSMVDRFKSFMWSANTVLPLVIGVVFVVSCWRILNVSGGSILVKNVMKTLGSTFLIGVAG